MGSRTSGQRGSGQDRGASVRSGFGAHLLVNALLRGPDEIAHFLRIYSYTRGGLLPAAEVDGRKGVFVEHELYTQLSFFKNAGERFARNREQGQIGRASCRERV